MELLTEENRSTIIERVHQGEEVTITTPQGIILELNTHTLVPHPDTYRLIEIAQNIIATEKEIQTICDIGTGSGIIAIALAGLFPNKKIYGLDIVPEALSVASVNARANNADISFHLNQVDNWINLDPKTKINFIISNPPYIGDEEFNSPNFLKEYPETALESPIALRTFDKYGISPYLEILKQATAFQTQYFLFQVNPLSVDLILKNIDSTKYYLELIKDKQNKFIRYLYINKP